MGVPRVMSSVDFEAERRSSSRYQGGSEDHVPRMSPWFPLYPSVVIRPRTLSGLFVARILALDRSSGADSSTLPLLRWLSDSETVWFAGEAQGRKRKS